MKYLIVLIMCLLATVKVSFQSAFGKRFVGTFLDSAIFNTAVFAPGALTFVWATEDVSPILWLYATLFVLSFFNFSIIKKFCKQKRNLLPSPLNVIIKL